MDLCARREGSDKLDAEDEAQPAGYEQPGQNPITQIVPQGPHHRLTSFVCRSVLLDDILIFF